MPVSISTGRYNIKNVRSGNLAVLKCGEANAIVGHDGRDESGEKVRSLNDSPRSLLSAEHPRSGVSPSAVTEATPFTTSITACMQLHIPPRSGMR